jgi:hypothetical protein
VPPANTIRKRTLAAAILLPSCFLVAPFVAFLAHNADAGIDPWQVLRYPAVALLPLVALTVAVWFRVGHSAAERLAVLLAVVLIAFFNYGALSDALGNAGLPTTMRLPVWGVIAALLAAIGFAWSRHASAIRFMTIAGVLAIALPLAQYMVSARPGAAEAAPVDEPGEPTFERTPDIYYIVPDAYGRADLLADEFGFDNSGFVEALRERGFRIEDDALASYPLTFLSVASTLEMDYPIEPAEDALAEGRGRFYDLMRGASALHRRLEGEGYTHTMAPSGAWEGMKCTGAEDLCVEPVSRRWLGGLLGEVEWELAHLTPVGDLIDTFFTDSFERPFADPVQVVKAVDQADLDSPAFVQVHLLQTHVPFHFDRACRPAPPQTHNLRTWSESGRTAYVESIECANSQLLNAIDLMPDDAIVVILADHGPAFTVDFSRPFEAWSEESLRERYSVLNAYRLPSACRDFPPASSVNIFRLVIACLEGTEPNLLPERWFFGGYEDETEIREMRRPPWRPSDASRSTPAP